MTTYNLATLLEDSATKYPDRTAVVLGDTRLTYAQVDSFANMVANLLVSRGIEPGDKVALSCPNLPYFTIVYYGILKAGGTVVPLNVLLKGREVAYHLDDSDAKAYFCFEGTPELAMGEAGHAGFEATPGCEHFFVITAALDGASPIEGVETMAQAMGSQPAEFETVATDEDDTAVILYTSGTTGQPKGVQYSHRGAYLNSFGEIVHSTLTPDSVYLWTLPMFHCNGWCTPWAITGIGGTHVCLREVRGDVIWSLIDEHRVTHLNGAPTVVTTIMRAPEAKRLDYQLVITTAGAPPSPTTILQMEQMGFRIVHVYGLTETYGPYSVNQYQRGWDDLEPEERASLQARQGVGMLQAEPLRVVDKDMADVPADGTTMGEIVMRGNNVMTGYYKDPAGTEKAFEGGWFHSGDLGVMYPDGFVELRDRAKDVVISGGENISTVEVEQAIVSHPAVLEAAVVGVPDEQYGERPKAFVVLSPGESADEATLIEHVKSKIARYKAPKAVEIVEELPKTSTGKIQKFELREKEWGEGGVRIRG
jgi:fatty-acyl-CoA synthase